MYGKCADTIIFARENGAGKSTILNALYTMVSGTIDFEADIEYENCEKINTLQYKYKTYSNGISYMNIQDDTGDYDFVDSDTMRKKYPMTGTYSDVDINFRSGSINSVTSMVLDEKTESRRSTNNLPDIINQLLIDIQALDDAEIAAVVREHPEFSGK